MTSGKLLYQIWAPEVSAWSKWVSPSFFAQIECGEHYASTSSNVPSLGWPESYMGSQSAVVVDLPGAESIRYGIALAKRRYRPIIINNASPGPSRRDMILGATSNSTYNLLALANEICATRSILQALNLPPNAPPAFILDSRRLKGDQAMRKVLFDNRWMVFPQDFPTASYLTERGIKKVMVVQEMLSRPQRDLADVLLHWQRSGIQIFLKEALGNNLPSEIIISAPNQFTEFIQDLLTSVGLREESIGGFGSTVGDFIRAG